tara:strand:+ start:207 stop:512 length:306 start_codon:yes stop_codon:yes gene_type:complete
VAPAFAEAGVGAACPGADATSGLALFLRGGGLWGGNPQEGGRFLPGLAILAIMTSAAVDFAGIALFQGQYLWQQPNRRPRWILHPSGHPWLASHLLYKAKG